MVTAPTIQWILQSSSVNPSGHRHQANPAYGFIKQLGTSAGQALDFGSINTTMSGAISETKTIYARISNMGSASGIFNLRFFLNSTSDFSTGRYRFLEKKDLHFIPNLILNDQANDTPRVIPQYQNLSGTIPSVGRNDYGQWQKGVPWISGTIDDDASMYIYLAFLAYSDVPNGIYGGAGAGSFRYRLLYDFS
jgi:hypothetical protein